MTAHESLSDLLAVAAIALDRASDEATKLASGTATIDDLRADVVALQVRVFTAHTQQMHGSPRSIERTAADDRLVTCLLEAQRLLRERDADEAVAEMERFVLTESSPGHRGIVVSEIEQLQTARAYDFAPNLLVSDSALAEIGALSPSDLETIDATVLKLVGPRFQKLAMIVAKMIDELSDRLPALPDVFYAQRVIRLVRLGQLESQGDLRRMRYSEVRRA